MPLTTRTQPGSRTDRGGARECASWKMRTERNPSPTQRTINPTDNGITTGTAGAGEPDRASPANFATAHESSGLPAFGQTRECSVLELAARSKASTKAINSATPAILPATRIVCCVEAKRIRSVRRSSFDWDHRNPIQMISSSGI